MTSESNSDPIVPMACMLMWVREVIPEWQLLAHIAKSSGYKGKKTTKINADSFAGAQTTGQDAT